MSLPRALRHLLTPPWWAHRLFSRDTLDTVKAAIAESERQHRGELRFVVEGALSPGRVLAGMAARERAVELFSLLRMWDTAENSGVLIYVQLNDRRVEIVADRGIAARVAQSEWDAICRGMESAFARGDYRGGALDAIRAAGELLVRHFPARTTNPNELPDRPLVY